MKYLTIILLLTLFSCQEEAIAPQQQTPTPSSIYCDYNGQTIDYIAIVSVNHTGNTYYITGVNDNGTTETDDDKGIQIVFNTDQTGTIQLDIGSIAANYIGMTFATAQGTNTMFSQFATNNGTVTVTAIDPTNKYIKGVFQTEMSNTTQTQTGQIADGYFEIYY